MTDEDLQPSNAKSIAFRDFLQKHVISLSILAVAFVVVLVVIFGSLGSYSGARNGLIDRETALNAQYQANQAELDTFTKKINEEFSVAGVKVAALDKFVTDAVKGRYDKELSASTPGTGGGIINALKEAYPDAGGIDVYDKIVTEISAGRDNFKEVQVKLLDQLRDYNTYRKHGLIHSFWVNRVGYPSLAANLGQLPTGLQCGEVLQANGACVLHGKLALAQMDTIVSSSATSGAFATGQGSQLTFTTPTTTK